MINIVFSTPRKILMLGVVAAALTFTQLAHAGRSCEQRPMQAQTLERAMGLAERTAQALAASGANVVMLARAGQDLSKYQLRYSHLGIAYKTPQGWRVLHKLNTCGTAEASLYLQGLGEFFMDDPFRYEAAFVPLLGDAQDALGRVAPNPSARARMQHKPYNMVSYPWSIRYQQSNQWALETLAFAMNPQARNRNQAQDWLQARNYIPTTLNIPPITRLGARVGSANVAFDDHPAHKRFSDRIETVTVESVFGFLQVLGLAGPMRVVQ